MEFEFGKFFRKSTPEKSSPKAKQPVRPVDENKRRFLFGKLQGMKDRLAQSPTEVDTDQLEKAADAAATNAGHEADAKKIHQKATAARRKAEEAEERSAEALPEVSQPAATETIPDPKQPRVAVDTAGAASEREPTQEEKRLAASPQDSKGKGISDSHPKQATREMAVDPKEKSALNISQTLQGKLGFDKEINRREAIREIGKFAAGLGLTYFGVDKALKIAGNKNAGEAAAAERGKNLYPHIKGVREAGDINIEIAGKMIYSRYEDMPAAEQAQHHALDELGNFPDCPQAQLWIGNEKIMEKIPWISTREKSGLQERLALSSEELAQLKSNFYQFMVEGEGKEENEVKGAYERVTIKPGMTWKAMTFTSDNSPQGGVSSNLYSTFEGETAYRFYLDSGAAIDFLPTCGNFGLFNYHEEPEEEVCFGCKIGAKEGGMGATSREKGNRWLDHPKTSNGQEVGKTLFANGYPAEKFIENSEQGPIVGFLMKRWINEVINPLNVKLAEHGKPIIDPKDPIKQTPTWKQFLEVRSSQKMLGDFKVEDFKEYVSRKVEEGLTIVSVTAEQPGWKSNYSAGFRGMLHDTTRDAAATIRVMHGNGGKDDEYGKFENLPPVIQEAALRVSQEMNHSGDGDYLKAMDKRLDQLRSEGKRYPLATEGQHLIMLMPREAEAEIIDVKPSELLGNVNFKDLEAR